MLVVVALGPVVAQAGLALAVGPREQALPLVDQPPSSGRRSRTSRRSIELDGDDRPCARAEQANRAASSAKVGILARVTTVPRPESRTIRAGPSNAQNISVMRPFSRTWATVSIPLPVRSR